jgi:hypothetical protein
VLNHGADQGEEADRPPLAPHDEHLVGRADYLLGDEAAILGRAVERRQPRHRGPPRRREERGERVGIRRTGELDLHRA